MALNTKQAVRLLSEDKSNYIHHNSLGHSTIYDSSGDELGKVSVTVFNRLLQTDRVKFAGESTMFWSNGYFRYSRDGKKV